MYYPESLLFETKQTDIFSLSSTGMPEYDEKLENSVGTIEYMSPKDYFQRCANAFRMSYQELYHQRVEEDANRVDKLVDQITSGHKLHLPVLDYSRESIFQEGLHRMAAAAQIYSWEDDTFPVLVIGEPSDDYEFVDADEFVDFANHSRIVYSDNICYKIYKHNIETAYMIDFFDGDLNIIIDKSGETYSNYTPDNELCDMFVETPSLADCVSYIYKDTDGGCGLRFDRLGKMNQQRDLQLDGLKALEGRTQNGKLQLGEYQYYGDVSILFEPELPDLIPEHELKDTFSKIKEIDIHRPYSGKNIQIEPEHAERLRNVETLKVLDSGLHIIADGTLWGDFAFPNLVKVYLPDQCDVDLLLLSGDGHYKHITLYVSPNSPALQRLLDQVQDFYDDTFQTNDEAIKALEQECNLTVKF